MSLRVAVQMDPLENINIAGDSSFALMLSAQARGFEVWHYDVATLAYDCLLYTSPSPRDKRQSRMPSSA